MIIEELIKQDLDYLRKELDKYISSKIYIQSGLKKGNKLQELYEIIKNTWSSYQYTFIFLIGSVIFSLLLLIIYLLTIIITISIINNILVFLKTASFRLLLLFQLLFAASLLIDYIIKPILEINSFRKSLKEHYYSKSVELHKIKEDTNIALSIANNINKNSCNILIREIYSLIKTKRRIRRDLSIVFLLCLFFLFYYLISFVDLPNINNLNSFSKTTSTILLGITIFNFILSLITQYWKTEPKEVKVLLDYISILERASDIAKDVYDDENIEATEELLNIPGFESAFERANRQVKEGKVRDWREIRDDV